MHLNDPPQKTLSDWLEHHPAATALPGKQAGGWTVETQCHFTSEAAFSFFCHAEVCKLLETDEKGDAAQSDTVQRQDKYGFWSHADFDQADKSCFNVDLSVCVPPGFVWRRVTSPRWATQMYTSGKSLSARLLDFACRERHRRRSGAVDFRRTFAATGRVPRCTVHNSLCGSAAQSRASGASLLLWLRANAGWKMEVIKKKTILFNSL